MGTTTTPSVGSNAAVSRGFPPCPDETNVGTIAKITMYDPKKFIRNNSSLQNVLDDVQDFYNNLKNVPNLPTNVSNELAGYTFQATYQSSAPTDAEIKAMGRMDFPMYIFHSPPISPDLSSVGEMHKLMVTHQIPSKLFLTTYSDPNNSSTKPTVNVYESISNNWGDEFTLGFGFPGIYSGQGTCHKLGIIKIDAVLKNNTGSATDKFKFVVKHELGHMFAVNHKAGTIMNKKYNLGFSDFEPLQIIVIRDTLKTLSP